MTRNLIALHVIIGSQKRKKIPPGAKFIIAGKKCINKQLSKHVTSAFELCYNQIDAYHKKTYYFNEPKPLGK